MILGGYSSTLILYRGTSSEWDENPFVTSVETERLINSGISFPTVTVCPEQFSNPDRWGLIRKIANDVKFECYDDQDPVSCQETEKTREHPATKEIFGNLVSVMERMMSKMDMSNVSFEDWEVPHINALIGVSEAQAVATAVERLGKSKDLSKSFNVSDDNAGNHGNISLFQEAKNTYKKLEDAFGSRGFVPYGTFLVSMHNLLDASGSFTAKDFYDDCSSLGLAEEALHDFFESLAKNLGIGEGLVSLFDLSTILSAQDVGDGYVNLRRFAHSSCAAAAFYGEEVDKVFFIKDMYAWDTHTFDHDDNGTHPCDEEGLRWECGFWSDRLGIPNGSLGSILRTMKLAHHLGRWRNYTVETGHFPVIGDGGGGGDQDEDHIDLLVPLSKFFDGPLQGGNGDFQPVTTDGGICLAASSSRMVDLLKEDSEYARAFEEGFGEDTSNAAGVREITGSSSLKFYNLRFYTDGQSLFRQEGRTSIEITLGWNKNMMDFRSTSIKLKPGVETIIRVLNFQESTISEGVEKVEMDKRGCRLPEETQGAVELFREYSHAGCKFECMIGHSAEKCRCVPWNYPSPVKNFSSVCDLMGANCFERTMDRQDLMSDCDGRCLKDCQSVRFDYTMQERPIDVEEECEKIPKGNIFTLMRKKRAKVICHWLS